MMFDKCVRRVSRRSCADCRLSPRVLHETTKLSIKMPNAPWPIYLQNVKCNSVETWYVERLKNNKCEKALCTVGKQT